MSFEDAHLQVTALVERFKASESFYLSKKYQEKEVRDDFINKFFIALGWDVRHESQTNPYEQEVKVERGVDVSGAQKRADYSFTLAPNFRDPKFYAEAKKPSKALYNRDYYFQTVRYGWHKTTPLAILTDFEELHILDCRFSPDFDTILNRQVKKFHYSDYLDADKFAEIYWLFSREAVINNSLEKYAETLPKPKGKAYQKALFAYEKHLTIDDAFLEEIDGIRETIAKAFKKNDDSLNSEELTESTQRTIDRLVFIRFLEDKLIEPTHYVNTFGDKGSAWGDFIALCTKLDTKYNGIVFKKSFIDDRNFKGPVDSEFHQICQNICHLNSRFLFNEIPIHILGSIYERFLGKVVHATAKRVTVEDKPEVRKAGGIYYTPKYIVDYIVQNTVGELIKGKTPAQISQMHFADIACGSGSFLIGVLECVIDYHNKYYQLYPDKAKRDGCLYKDGLWILSIKQKQNILRNNIYGVDIDMQAVEVTQLSLALKMLEDETTATANEMQVLFHERILPDMTKNIVCGNSLIENDILAEDLFAIKEERKFNPLDIENSFPIIFKEGGFDAIIGNPPWVDIKGLDPIQVNYFFKKYKSVENRMNLYAVFMERSLKLLSKRGIFSFIIPNSVLYQSSYTKLRKYILNQFSISNIVRLPDNTFKKVIAETVILIINNDIKKEKIKCLLYDRTDRINIISDENAEEIKLANQSSWIKNDLAVFDIYSNELTNSVLIKIENNTIKFERKCNFCLGLTPYDKYKGHTNKQIEGRVFHSITIKDNTFKKLLAGGDVGRYFVEWGGKEYISYGNWLGAPRDKKFFIEERILVRQIVSGDPLRIYASITSEELYNQQSIFNIIKKDCCNENLKYLLAILNSKMMNFYHRYRYLDLSKNVFQKILIQNCKNFPIKEINFQNKTEKDQHDKLIKLVDMMLLAKKTLEAAKTDKDKTYYERRCSEIDSRIDALVYKLYSLTEEEIAVIENSVQ